MTVLLDKVLTALTQIALGLEREANENTPSDNLISVRNRLRAQASLSTVQSILADDWLVEQLAIRMHFDG